MKHLKKWWKKIRDVLEHERINVGRAHRVDNKGNERNAPRTIVPKFSSYKDKQTILSVEKKKKNEKCLKETLEIRKENWQTVYDRIVTKGKFYKQQNKWL